MKNDFLIAITQICAEKNLPREVVLDALEAALVSAYKRSFGAGQNVVVKIGSTTGEVKVFTNRSVVEEVTNPQVEVDLKEARAIKKDAQLGDVVELETIPPRDFGRIAAQTAKQVVLQRLREAERETVYDEFVEREGDVISGLIQRVDAKQVIIDLGKAEAILPASEQISTERYRAGQRIRAYLLEVQRTSRGPLLTVSRTHRNFLRRLFELEVPEIFNGVVELKAVAREPGSRSKVAVGSRQAGVDPVGACVGMRGVRIQNIVRELDGEKIDVVQWDDDPAVFVANALSPAQVVGVSIRKSDKVATVVVPDRLLSLAIGKDGQNARLAARLTGWKIDIKSVSTSKVEEARLAAEAAAKAAEEARLEAESRAYEEAIAVVDEAEAVLTQAAPVIEEVPHGREVVKVTDELVVPAPEVEMPSPAGVAPKLEPVIPAPVSDSVVAGRRQIRFAEEILAVSADKVGVVGKKKKEKGRRDKEEGPPKKKVRRGGRLGPGVEEDIDEDIDEDFDFDIK
ncbi:MAG: transcription termination factor NusA [Dehalococcoidia bacterium]|nr:transcription termination factor NusA [Dehalococcoidia bacterium]